jgi:exportin-2 (importin alpha re-exporter)
MQLTAQDLPEFFEDHLSEWMAVFNTLLKYTNPQLDADDDDSDPSPISCLQVRVCIAIVGAVASQP